MSVDDSHHKWGGDMTSVWPVKKIELAQGVRGAWKNIKAMRERDEVFVLRYNADDNKSGYIYLNSYDGKSKSLVVLLQRYGLDALTPYVKKEELLLMW